MKPEQQPAGQDDSVVMTRTQFTRSGKVEKHDIKASQIPAGLTTASELEQLARESAEKLYPNTNLPPRSYVESVFQRSYVESVLIDFGQKVQEPYLALLSLAYGTLREDKKRLERLGQSTFEIDAMIEKLKMQELTRKEGDAKCVSAKQATSVQSTTSKGKSALTVQPAGAATADNALNQYVIDSEDSHHVDRWEKVAFRAGYNAASTAQPTSGKQEALESAEANCDRLAHEKHRKHQEIQQLREQLAAAQEYNAKCHARMSERKSVHQWLTAQNIPEEENGKRICLLRRLRITLDRLAETENEVEGLKEANRGLYIESNQRFQQLAAAQAAIEKIDKVINGEEAVLNGKISGNLVTRIRLAILLTKE